MRSCSGTFFQSGVTGNSGLSASLPGADDDDDDDAAGAAAGAGAAAAGSFLPSLVDMRVVGKLKVLQRSDFADSRRTPTMPPKVFERNPGIPLDLGW